MCSRSTAEYEEELCGPKEEKEPQRQRLDAVFNRQPRTVPRRAGLGIENQEPTGAIAPAPRNRPNPPKNKNTQRPQSAHPEEEVAKTNEESESSLFAKHH
ncbi:uncharacterized protein LOC133398271 isoform X2 [Phycodurus eques]|uniref:uncharacterized protein LOC133398271 isoform X2 n=1 Tax=Phycodurus eques TaxID=693459 RepID=UPI002ACDE924|nr:uncharacterized protein LOC133398271 isoform X2 [Phycodurus eques]